MEQYQYGDAVDLGARLEAFASETDRRLVTVFGSGVSNSVLPDVTAMTRLFGEAIPAAGRQRFQERIEPITGTVLGYQNAASLLRNQAGDRAVARVIRRAVLMACSDVGAGDFDRVVNDVERCRQLARSGTWRIPRGYEEFAKMYAKLPGSARGPIITTNFDPLLEVALNQAGVLAEPVPIAWDRAPTPDQIGEKLAVPILHIHGYWTTDSTLNTITQLTKERPILEGLLRNLIRNALVLVIAYGAWDDALTRSLKERIREADLLDAEVLWAAYGSIPEQVLTNELLAELVGLTGFTLYLGINANDAFSLSEPPGSASIVVESPFGYTRLPLSVIPQESNGVYFANGSQPTWGDADSGLWPRLAPTNQVVNQMVACLTRGWGGAVGVGPVGEGKSLGLRQAAVDLSREHVDWTFLWREPAAPPITENWLVEVRSKYGKVVICSDDADLVAPELVATQGLWAQEDSGIVFLLASNDRLWWPKAASLRTRLETIVYHGLSDADALAICMAWSGLGLKISGDESSRSLSAEAMATRLIASTQAMIGSQQRSLFGAILDVRFGAGLRDRIRDLLAKLSSIHVSPDSSTTLADVFGGICVLQHTLDPNGSLGRGASRSLIAGMVDLQGVFADGRILRDLGREAAIAYAGNRIYSRHPSIAQAVIECLRDAGGMAPVCRLLGRSGGRLRDSGGLPEAEYNGAYMVARNLLDFDDAHAAALGAIEGAPSLLEPRVSMMAVLRRFQPDSAERYAAELSHHLRECRDYGVSVRGFFSEYSIIARVQGEAYLALGLGGLAIQDELGLSLESQRATYALAAITKAAVELRKQDAGQYSEVVDSAFVLLEIIVGPAEAKKWVKGVRSPRREGADGKPEGVEVVCGRLGSALKSPVDGALATVGIRSVVTMRPGLMDLARLVAHAQLSRQPA